MPTFTPRLNLTQPDTGSKTWETAIENWAHQLDKAAAQYLIFHLGGEAIDEEIIFEGLFFDELVTITEVDLYAREAPTGAPFTIELIKDGNEQLTPVSIPDGAKKGNALISGLAYTVFDEFGLKVKSVGSNTAGAEITICVHYHINALEE